MDQDLKELTPVDISKVWETDSTLPRGSHERKI